MREGLSHFPMVSRRSDSVREQARGRESDNDEHHHTINVSVKREKRSFIIRGRAVIAEIEERGMDGEKEVEGGKRKTLSLRKTTQNGTRFSSYLIFFVFYFAAFDLDNSFDKC